MSWQPMESAPRDGSEFAAREVSVDRLTGRRRVIKAMCFRAEGRWCRRYRSEIIYWEPTHWQVSL